MDTHHNRLTSYIMIFAAILGLVLSLGGLAGTWLLQPQVTQSALNTLQLAQNTLTTSGQLLDVVDATLITTGDDLVLLQTGLDDIATALGKSAPTLRSAGKMTGTDLTQMTRDTHNALISLKSTAKIIDDSLRFISTVPLVGQPYDPPAPLDVSIGNLADSMDKLPANLSEIQGWLDGTATDVEKLQKDTAAMATSIGQLNPQLKSARTVTAQYQKQVKDLKQVLSQMQTQLPDQIMLAAIIISLFLAWIGLSQVGTFAQGFERLKR